MKALHYACLIFLLLPVWLLAAWENVSTDYFKVYYRTGMEAEAIHALQVMEYYRPRLERLTGNTATQTAIKLEDMGNLVNGYANPLGNVIGLYMYPPTSNELAYGEDWFQVVAPHEYIHKLQMTHAGGIPALARNLFGNLLYPQLHQPMWMTEGITVYGESQLSPYTGRMNSAYYSSLISALAVEDKLPSPTKAAYYSMDTPLAHYYVFGGSFHKYLAENYGEGRFGILYQDNSSRITAYANGIMPSLALDPAFINSYGHSLEDLWSGWQQSEKDKATRHNATRYTFDGWEKDDLKHYDQTLYYTRHYEDKTGPGRTFHKLSLMKLDLRQAGAEPQEVLRQATEFPASYHLLGNKLYFSRTEYRRGFANKDNDAYGSISQILLRDDRGTKIVYTGQVRAFLPLMNGDILIAEDKPLYRGSQLLCYSPGSGHKEFLYSGDALIHKICMDGDKIWVNAREYWKNSAIYSLEDGFLQPLINSPASFKLLDACNGLLRYNTIVNNELQAWEYDGKSHRKYQYPNYMKDPVPGTDGQVWFLSLNALGMDLYHAPIKAENSSLPGLAKSEAPFPRINSSEKVIDKLPANVRRGSYADNIAHLLNPRILHLPQLYGRQDSLAIGAVLVGNDAVGDFPQYQIQGVYDTFAKEFIGDFALSSTVLSPVHQDILLSSEDDGTLMLNSSMSLYQRQNYGLVSVNAGLGAISWEAFERRMLYPFVSSGFSWPSGQAGIRNSVYWEDIEALSSTRDRLGWQGQIQIRQRMSKKSELNTMLNLAYDPDADSDDVFYPLRGYEDELQSGEGFTIRNTWYHPLFRVRSGIWSPQVYLEDINLGLFFDAAAIDDVENSLQYSSGLELIGEFSFLFMGQMNIGLRYGINKDQEQFLGLILGS